MSFAMNHVMFGGNLTRDIDLKTLPSGTLVGETAIAINERKKDGDQWVDDPIFFDVSMFGKVAEKCASLFKKGDSVTIIGRIRRDKWEKDGQKRQKDSVIANEVVGVRWGKDRSPRDENPQPQPGLQEPPF